MKGIKGFPSRLMTERGAKNKGAVAGVVLACPANIL
jgi:hypothetical protein